MDSFMIKTRDDARKFVESLKKDGESFTFKIPVIMWPINRYEWAKMEYNEANKSFRFHRCDLDYRNEVVWRQTEDEMIDLVCRYAYEINEQLKGGEK